MKKLLGIGFWEFIARIILRNRIVLLCLVGIITILMAFQWKHLKFTHTEANLIPADDIVNINYNSFLKNFGEEGNLIVIGTRDDKLFTPKTYSAWSELMQKLKSDKEIDLVITVDNLQKLTKNDSLKAFELTPLVDKSKTLDESYLKQINQNCSIKCLFMKDYCSIKNQVQFVQLFI
jgi:uncharacterized protein